jgi:hypothetical protein
MEWRRRLALRNELRDAHDYTGPARALRSI